LGASSTIADPRSRLKRDQNDIGTLKEKLLNTNRLSIVIVLFSLAVQYTENVHAATNDKLDVNLNVVYVGTKSQKNSNALSEVIIQFPFPLSESARNTGQGFFGGVTYFDNKTLVSDTDQTVSEMGLARVYYSYSVPGDTAYTFVPFVTFYRQFTYNYQVSAKLSSQLKGNSYILPGVLYAYRFNEKLAFHLDVELYSYAERTNNRGRIGFSYSPSWPWIISASHERFSWDIDGRGVFVDGHSKENSLKIIFRDPPQGNFALTIGYGSTVRNAVGSALLFPGSSASRGTYFGIEASGGVLAW
jgi:hypothetical protein